MELNKRHTGLDLLRILAMLFVAGLHFFLNTGFYEQPVQGGEMYVMVMLRNAFMVCVPLFLIMSGAVMGDKKPTAGYFLGILKVVTIYLLASLCCGAYRVFVTHDLSLREMVYGILTYQTASYSWYIEMYLGLFLLVPFLNLAYDALQTQKKKKVLLAVMLILTALFHLAGFVAGLLITVCSVVFNRTISGKSYLYPLVPFHGKEAARRFLRTRIPHRQKDGPRD